MKDKIKISVLMAVYNTEFYLVKRAIESVLKQSFQDFELIVIDDGSQNDTQNQLLNYIKKYEDKITYLRHKNCGQSESINRGILNSRGEYISILDADDEYKRTHLQSCLDEIQDYDLMSSTTETIVDTEEDYYVPDKHNPQENIHVDDCVLFATLFGKRKVFVDLKFLNMYAADAHFYELATQKYKVKKVNLRTYIYYRNIPNSICTQMKVKSTIASR